MLVCTLQFYSWSQISILLPGVALHVRFFSSCFLPPLGPYIISGSAGHQKLLEALGLGSSK